MGADAVWQWMETAYLLSKQSAGYQRDVARLQAENARLRIAAQEMPVDEIEQHFQALEKETWPSVYSCQNCEQLKAEIARLEAELQAQETRTEELRHQFKNFHRSLCSRFGYAHDTINWWRDLVSLEEWIAGKVAQAKLAEKEV